MAPLLTTGQSRWALHILLSLLSATAIASSAPSAAGGVNMYSGNPGDIRGPAVMIGGIGLGGSLFLRTAFVLLPKPWRAYLDRLEFTFISVLWVCWTSATMAFSAFTLDQGVCSSTYSEYYLPTCPLLMFDLVLLHLLSVVTLTLLLVILSTALSPTYYLALSTSMSQGADGANKIDPEDIDVFVMWEMAVASPPSSPLLGSIVPTTPLTGRSYGTQSPATPIRPSAAPPVAAGPSQVDVNSPPRRRDRFAEGRLWSYIPLVLCSLGAVVGVGVSLNEGSNSYGAITIFLFTIAGLNLAFAIGFIGRHYKQRYEALTGAERQSFMLRNDRALEVGFASILFILWPLAAITYTLFPPTPNRPCTNPAASLDDPPALGDTDTSIMCTASITAVALAWLASWLILVRVLGLVVPLPEMGRLPVTPANGSEESQRLLRNEHDAGGNPEARPQVKWGRMVAGEAFELGDDEDDD